MNCAKQTPIMECVRESERDIVSVCVCEAVKYVYGADKMLSLPWHKEICVSQVQDK